LSVGAMNTGNRVADFSGSQRFNRPINPLCPALVAPGVGVLSCVPGNKYKTMDGSSMATPHVAGLAALLLQARPTATANDLERAIVGSCTLPAGMPAARGSHGVPDAVRAFEILTGTPLPAVAAAAPPRRVAKRGVRERMPVGRKVGRTANKAGRRPKVAASRKKTASKRKRG
jgi:subtilisin